MSRNYFDSAGSLALDFGRLKFGFEWSRATDGARKAAVLHALKGRTPKGTWRFFAEQFLIQHFESLERDSWIVVPAPPSVPGKADHALLWAECLSETIGGHCLPLLKRSRPELEQKALDRASRQQVTMELADGVSSRRLKQLSRKGWKFVFADDVFTTGATARAAWKALGEPKPFQIWTLSYRASLRSDS